jgi:hypothetical protein
MKKIIITEHQLNNIILEQKNRERENFKPSEEFDKKYGTNLSQTYEFPLNLTEEEVWKDYINCKNNKKCNSFERIVMNLESFHFPYPNVDRLDYKIKRDIVLGMVSRLNYDDIVWYSIENNTGMSKKSRDIFGKIYETFGKEMDRNIEWIVSEKTFEKMKEQLSVLKENKLKKLIREELIGFISTTNVWKNPKIDNIKFDIYNQPKSIKRMEPDIRGIIREDGELFVVNDSRNIIHENLRTYLHNKGLIKYFGNVFVMRDDNTNNFYLSESYFDEYSITSIFDNKYDFETSYNKVLEILDRCKMKNPQYNFIPNNINYKDEDFLDIINQYTIDV